MRPTGSRRRAPRSASQLRGRTLAKTIAARSREPYRRAQCRTEARRPDRSERRSDRALRRSLNEAAYADLALAGAASALLHPHWAHVMHWAKAGAANTVANATAAISVFMVSLHQTHLQ